MDKESYEFYKNFYDENRVALLQYESLRVNFNKMVDNVLGKSYYNEGHDVYQCDELTCIAIEKTVNKNKTIMQRIFGE